MRGKASSCAGGHLVGMKQTAYSPVIVVVFIEDEYDRFGLDVEVLGDDLGNGFCKGSLFSTGRPFAMRMVTTGITWLPSLARNRQAEPKPCSCTKRNIQRGVAPTQCTFAKRHGGLERGATPRVPDGEILDSWS